MNRRGFLSSLVYSLLVLVGARRWAARTHSPPAPAAPPAAGPLAGEPWRNHLPTDDLPDFSPEVWWNALEDMSKPFWERRGTKEYLRKMYQACKRPGVTGTPAGLEG